MGKPLPSRNEIHGFSTQYLFYKTLNILVFWAGIVSCTRKLPYTALSKMCVQFCLTLA